MPTVLIIKDREGCVYGGYASQPWERHSDYYGDMKSFLFQIYPAASIFRPTGANTNIQWVHSFTLLCQKPTHLNNIDGDIPLILKWVYVACAVCCQFHFREHSKWNWIRRTGQSLWPFHICELRPGPDLLLHDIREPLSLQDKQNTTRRNRMLGHCS